MAFAPLVGAGLGAAAAGVGQVADWWTRSPLISATAAIATLAALTRALHLDGLADTADGLGSGKPAAEALDIMKRSDIGPFGVVTLILVLAVQISSLTAAYGSRRGAVAIIVAAMAGRRRSRSAAAGRSRRPRVRPGRVGRRIGTRTHARRPWEQP